MSFLIVPGHRLLSAQIECLQPLNHVCPHSRDLMSQCFMCHQSVDEVFMAFTHVETHLTHNINTPTDKSNTVSLYYLLNYKMIFLVGLGSLVYSHFILSGSDSIYYLLLLLPKYYFINSADINL